MKKILFSLCALAALAACTKSEVQYEPSGEISFAPVAKTLTKSVAGYNGETFDGVFPTNVNLYVFANASNDAGTAWEDPYFANALFRHNAGKGTEGTQTRPTLEPVATTGAYAGDPTRYWPNVKTLKFIGYSAACNVAATSDGTSAEVSDDFTTLTISNYTQDNDNTTEGANDLMYFHALQENGYSKSEGEIAAQMKHACSWITINVAKHNSLENIEYKLNKLELATFYHSGKVVCATTGATWAKDNLGYSKTEVYCDVTSNNTITTSFKNFETTKNNFIVIPQTPVKLNVTYTYTSDDLGTTGTSDDLTLKETAPVSLALADGTDWKAGVHYIYNVTITATEILIDPVVVDWTTGTTPAVTLPENN